MRHLASDFLKFNNCDIPGTNSDEGALNAVGFLDGRASFDDMEKHWDKLAPLKLFHRCVSLNNSLIPKII